MHRGCSQGLFTLALGRRVCRAGKLSGTVCGADREGTPHAAGAKLSPQPAARAAPAKLGKALERDGGRHFPGHVRHGTGFRTCGREKKTGFCTGAFPTVAPRVFPGLFELRKGGRKRCGRGGFPTSENAQNLGSLFAILDCSELYFIRPYNVCPGTAPQLFWKGK